MRTLEATRKVVNPAHVAALSAAIVVHMLGVGLLLRPMSLPQMPLVLDSIPVIFIDSLKKPLPPPPPPVPQPPQEVVRQSAPHQVATPTRAISQSQQSTATTVQTSEAIDDTQPETNAIATQVTTPQVDPSSSPKGLVVVSSSRPPYPADALRAGIQGEVVLMVSVDAQGHPVDVSILASSGSRSLDRAARQHVLKHWIFQATGVQQSARLPIRFSIQ